MRGRDERDERGGRGINVFDETQHSASPGQLSAGHIAPVSAQVVPQLHGSDTASARRTKEKQFWLLALFKVAHLELTWPVIRDVNRKETFLNKSSPR